MMLSRRIAVGLVTLLLLPTSALAAPPAPVNLPVWSVAPFLLLLLSIALLPLAAPHWWHSNRNRAAVAAIFALPTILYLAYMQVVKGQATLPILLHELGNYVSFIILLGSLYAVAGGILLKGDLPGKPLTNTAFLATGAVLANLIGTTGASVLLIRFALRFNRQRRNTAHLPVFFIFLVSNVGGQLTPLGDPPLFLRFLHGVPCTWTLSLWPHWLLVNGTVLVVFWVWDTIAYRRESADAIAQDTVQVERLGLE